jgi:hypothetical protein
LHIFAPAEFASVVKKDTAVVAGDVIAKTKATVEQNLNKASEVATLAARCALAVGTVAVPTESERVSERQREWQCQQRESESEKARKGEGSEAGREREKEREGEREREKESEDGLPAVSGLPAAPLYVASLSRMPPSLLPQS